LLALFALLILVIANAKLLFIFPILFDSLAPIGMVEVALPITLSILRRVKCPQRPNMIRHNLVARLSILLCHFRLAHQSFALAHSAENLQLLLYISILLMYRTCFLVPYERAVLESAAVILPGTADCSAMG
jgi:hypothetical protein